MFDPELLREKVMEYVNEKYAKLTHTGTLIMTEILLPLDDITRLIEEHGIKCPKNIRQLDIEILYYAEPKCYSVNEFGKGEKLTGLNLFYTTSIIDVIQFYDYERERFLSDLADEIASITLLYYRPFFEAFLRGFLSDEDSLYIYGVNDAVAYNDVVRYVTGGVDVDYKEANTLYRIVIKLPKSKVKEEYRKYDVLFMDIRGKTINLVPSDRDTAFRFLAETYDLMRNVMLRSLSELVRLRGLLETLVKETSV